VTSGFHREVDEDGTHILLRNVDKLPALSDLTIKIRKDAEGNGPGLIAGNRQSLHRGLRKNSKNLSLYLTRDLNQGPS
jgi:hypothetical protein